MIVRETSKAIAGAIVAIACTLPGLLVDGWQLPDLWLLLGAAAAGYLGVWVAPRNRDVQRDRIRRRPGRRR